MSIVPTAAAMTTVTVVTVVMATMSGGRGGTASVPRRAATVVLRRGTFVRPRSVSVMRMMTTS